MMLLPLPRNENARQNREYETSTNCQNECRSPPQAPTNIINVYSNTFEDLQSVCCETYNSLQTLCLCQLTLRDDTNGNNLNILKAYIYIYCTRIFGAWQVLTDLGRSDTAGLFVPVPFTYQRGKPLLHAKK
jgi:hypothetical protein